MLKWKAYWISMGAILFGLLYWKNYKTYFDKSLWFKLGKSGIECAFIIASAIWAPVLLVVYGSTYLTKNLKRPYIKLGLGVLVGMSLMMLVGYALELVILLAVFAVDLLSGDFLKFYNERRKLREVR